MLFNKYSDSFLNKQNNFFLNFFSALFEIGLLQKLF